MSTKQPVSVYQTRLARKMERDAAAAAAATGEDADLAAALAVQQAAQQAAADKAAADKAAADKAAADLVTAQAALARAQERAKAAASKPSGRPAAPTIVKSGK